eukprot:scaffold17662_cov183-Skeletonema_marinoi.AAC.2
MSPIEYAIVSDANINVVKLLQKASMTLRRQEAQTSKATARSYAAEIRPIVPLPRSEAKTSNTSGIVMYRRGGDSHFLEHLMDSIVQFLLKKPIRSCKLVEVSK